MFNTEYLLDYQDASIHDMKSTIAQLEFVGQQKDDELEARRDTMEYCKGKVEFFNIIK